VHRASLTLHLRATRAMIPALEDSAALVSLFLMIHRHEPLVFSSNEPSGHPKRTNAPLRRRSIPVAADTRNVRRVARNARTKRNAMRMKPSPSRAAPRHHPRNPNITEQCGRGAVVSSYALRVRAQRTYTRTTHKCTRGARYLPIAGQYHAHLACTCCGVASLSHALSLSFSLPLSKFASSLSPRVAYLVRAYISKPVVTAPPRRYLSRASGTDFYRLGDSRGKFIKPLHSPLRPSCPAVGT